MEIRLSLQQELSSGIPRISAGRTRREPGCPSRPPGQGSSIMPRIASGDFVVINAASSSVGLSSIQLARRAGAKSIALTRTRVKAQALRDAGASHVIVTENEDVAQAVLKITEQCGARIIFDAIGGKAFSSLVAAAAPEGIVLVYGARPQQGRKQLFSYSGDTQEIDDPGNRFDGNAA
jgi:NADPH:quinone reductase-like Zn-dependent oxidoreductase